MFKERARRLLRTTWRTPQKLAEELFAILSHDGPLEHTGPLNLTPDGDGPAIRIVIPGEVPTTDPIEVVHLEPDGTFTPIGTIPYVPGGGGGDDDPGGGGGGGSPFPDPDESGDTQTDEDRQTSPAFMPASCLGEVISGSGTEYTVGVWLNDPDGGDADYWMIVPATVVQIDPAEQVPAGTVVTVHLFYPTTSLGVVAYFQPPVAL